MVVSIVWRSWQQNQNAYWNNITEGGQGQEPSWTIELRFSKPISILSSWREAPPIRAHERKVVRLGQGQMWKFKEGTRRGIRENKEKYKEMMVFHVYETARLFEFFASLWRVHFRCLYVCPLILSPNPISLSLALCFFVRVLLQILDPTTTVTVKEAGGFLQAFLFLFLCTDLKLSRPPLY